jgi:hypothetical protein
VKLKPGCVDGEEDWSRGQIRVAHSEHRKWPVFGTSVTRQQGSKAAMSYLLAYSQAVAVSLRRKNYLHRTLQPQDESLPGNGQVRDGYSTCTYLVSESVSSADWSSQNDDFDTCSCIHCPGSGTILSSIFIAMALSVFRAITNDLDQAPR